MNVLKASLDTRHENSVIGMVTQFDHATLELQILSGGQVGEAWDNPRFELIATKRDMNSVREVDQDKFTILSKEDHKVQIELKEQFLTCRGSVKMQLVIKDGSRLSTTLFYLSIGRSLDHEIVESLTDIQVLDDLDQVVESLGALEVTASANESKRQENEKLREVAEVNRQEEFNQAQLQRDTKFNNKMEEFQEQVSSLEGIQGKPGETPQIRVNETHIQLKYPSQQEWTDLVALESLKGPEGPKGPPGIQGKTGEPGKDGANGEDGQDGMTPNFTIGTVTTLEPGQEATVTIRGTKENPILDIAIPRGNDGKDGQGGGSGIEAADKVDYMGGQHNTLKETNDANVEYLLREINTAHYEGSNITATDTYQKQVKSAILKGKSGYRDKDTGEILEAFEEGRNLELVSVKMPVLMTKNKVIANDLTFISKTNEKSTYVINDRTIEFNFSGNWSNFTFSFNYEVGYTYNISFNTNGAIAVDFNSLNSNRVTSKDGFVTKDFKPSGEGKIIIYGITSSEVTFTDFVISKVETKDEPFKSNILSTPEDLVMRSNGNVKDALDLVTGEVTRHIEEIVLDGSENWRAIGTSANDSDLTRFYTGDLSVVGKNDSLVICDKMSSSVNWNPTVENIYHSNTGYGIVVLKSGLSDVDSFKSWLSQNPITVQYQLAENVIKTVDLNGQKVYSYDGTTHYSCSAAEGALIPTLSIDVPTNLSALVSRQRTTIENQKEQIITLEEENEQLIAQNEVQDIDISLNQDAINFMLFAPATMSVNDESKNSKGANTMAAYLANQILKGRLDYTLVVSRYGEFKEDIDTILISEGKQDLIK